MAAKSTTTTLTTKQVATALDKGVVTAEEERALRMRHGAKVSPTAPLPQKAAAGSEAADELLLMEMQLLKAYRAHLASQGRGPSAVKATPTTQNRAKDKIVRALRKKR
ncbi:MAG: hypothetical protein JST54_18015 [Deltaproteobacteria bacterium]|nr:hypothetical protein [Deltaproteobacteria bacterium]